MWPERRNFTAEERDVLRRAGLSEESALTDAEYAGLRAAKFALHENPAMSRDAIYRTIRPRVEFPDE